MTLIENTLWELRRTLRKNQESLETETDEKQRQCLLEENERLEATILQLAKKQASLYGATRRS